MSNPNIVSEVDAMLAFAESYEQSKATQPSDTTATNLVVSPTSANNTVANNFSISKSNVSVADVADVFNVDFQQGVLDGVNAKGSNKEDNPNAVVHKGYRSIYGTAYIGYPEVKISSLGQSYIANNPAFTVNVFMTSEAAKLNYRAEELLAKMDLTTLINNVVAIGDHLAQKQGKTLPANACVITGAIDGSELGIPNKRIVMVYRLQSENAFFKNTTGVNSEAIKSVQTNAVLNKMIKAKQDLLLECEETTSGSNVSSKSNGELELNVAISMLADIYKSLMTNKEDKLTFDWLVNNGKINGAMYNKYQAACRASKCIYVLATLPNKLLVKAYDACAKDFLDVVDTSGILSNTKCGLDLTTFESIQEILVNTGCVLTDAGDLVCISDLIKIVNTTLNEMREFYNQCQIVQVDSENSATDQNSVDVNLAKQYKLKLEDL